MDGNEGVVTMEDVLTKQSLLEEEAKAKMLEDWGDENSCTFEKGYIKQPVYSCLTCYGKSCVQFGFCFGCSMNCHVDHDVVEIFDKRNFKCDCGTPNSGCQCILPPLCDRSNNNTENKYSHNFCGKYCNCDLGYNPDLDIMLQCAVCEDWFHEECIKKRTIVPDHTTFKDFICVDCFNRCDILRKYTQHQVCVPTGVNTEATATTTTTITVATNDAHTASNECKCSDIPACVTHSVVDTFWKSGWRKQLCTCTTCKQLYVQLSVTFLIEETEDDDNGESDELVAVSTLTTALVESTASTYATPATVLGGTKRPYMSMLEDSAEKAFLKSSTIDHESKLNIIQGYNEMSTKLKAFLDTFAKSGKTVTKQDIDDFFAELSAKHHKSC